jgi:ketosteroid isomerase-like protein
MDAAQSKQIVQSAWQTFASRDPVRIAQCLTPDAEWLAPPANATATALAKTNHMAGADTIAAFLATGFRKLFVDNVKIDFRGFHADTDVVIVEYRMTATLRDGRPYDNDYCLIFELKDGRIHRVREYMDTLRGHRMIFGEDSAAASV